MVIHKQSAYFCVLTIQKVIMGDNTISRNIRKFREKLKMTQPELASLVGVCPNTISNYETGRTNVKLKDIPKLAQALKVSENDILPGYYAPVAMEDPQEEYETAPEKKVSELQDEVEDAKNVMGSLLKVITERDDEIKRLKETIADQNDKITKLEAQAALREKRNEFGAEPEND